MRSEVLLIGGRAGVGKSSVGNEVHVQLSAARVWHAFIEGDNLDLAFPPPWEHRLAERNLAAVWSNYRELGYRRMIYTNTASVRAVDSLTVAMGDSPHVTAVLLTCRDATARRRLAQREIGGALQAHIERGKVAARELEKIAPPWVHRVNTDDQTVADVTAQVIGLAGWIAN